MAKKVAVGDRTSPVPMFRVMAEPDNVIWQWSTLFNLFHLADRRAGVPARINLKSTEKELVQEFISRASAVAQQDAAWRESSVVYEQTSEPTLTAEFDSLTDSELESWCLSFRKLYGEGEPGATFRNMLSQLNRMIINQLDTEETVAARALIDPIQSAEKALRSNYLECLAFWEANPRAKDKGFKTGYLKYEPEELISIMFYGGYLHAGKKKEQFKELLDNGSEFHMAKHAFVGHTRAMSLLYMEFAEVLLVLARDNGLARPLSRNRHKRQVRFIN